MEIESIELLSDNERGVIELKGGYQTIRATASANYREMDCSHCGWDEPKDTSPIPEAA